jgi:hypothetical protein
LNTRVIGPRAAAFFAALTLLYCAAAINFSWIQSENNSDTVLPALVSIDRYSPFYWSENRFGMLVPLLAMPVRNYGWNLLVQSQLIIAAGIGVMVLLARFSNSRLSAALTVPITVCLLFAVLKPSTTLILLLPGSPYLASLFLSLTFLWVFFEIEGRAKVRAPVGALLLMLSFWVNISNVVIVIVAVVTYPRKPTSTLKWRIAGAGVTLGCAAAVSLISNMYPGTDFRSLLPMSSWLDSFTQLTENLDTLIRPITLATAMGAALGMQLTGPRVYKSSYAIGLGAMCQVLAIAASEWVSKNGYDPRYILGPVALIAAVAMYELSGVPAGWLERRLGRPASAALGCLLAVATVTALFGVPSARAALRDIDRATSGVAAPVRDLACTHVIGNYWNVWEAVFNDRLRTQQQRLWGVSHRSDAIRSEWSAVPRAERRYCAICTDSQLEYMRLTNGVGKLQKEAERDGICVYRELP